MISSVTLPKFGSSQINQNKSMKNPNFKGETSATETDKNVNYKDWAKKNAAKIALGATALAGVVAAGILIKRGSSKGNDLTDELQKDTTQALSYTLEKFRQEGNIFRNSTAITKDGEQYKGVLTHTKKDGSNITLTFKNGLLRYSKIVKDGETIVNKKYYFKETKEGEAPFLRRLKINGNEVRLKTYATWFPVGKYNIIGGHLRANRLISTLFDDPINLHPPKYVYICGKKLEFSARTMDKGEGKISSNNVDPKTMYAHIKYYANDLDNPNNYFRMIHTSYFVEGKKYPTCPEPKQFELILPKFKDDFGRIEIKQGCFKSNKKDVDLFKYNYHTKEISDLNGISKEDAQEMVDFWERHYAGMKEVISARSYMQQQGRY